MSGDGVYAAERFIVYWNCPGIECGAITVISHYGTTGSRSIAARKSRCAIGDGDGPLRDTFTNRDINTKRSFIFFYASLPRSRPRCRPRILTRPSRRPPVKILVVLLQLPSLSPPVPDPARSLTGSRSGFRARFTPRSRRLQRSGEFYDDFVQSLYSRSLQYAPPSNWSRFWTVYIRAGTATYTSVAGEYWEGRTIRPSGDCPLKPDAGSVISRRATWNASRCTMRTRDLVHSFVRFHRKILSSSNFFFGNIDSAITEMKS